jgi:hypothetical protein
VQAYDFGVAILEHIVIVKLMMENISYCHPLNPAAL